MNNFLKTACDVLNEEQQGKGIYFTPNNVIEYIKRKLIIMKTFGYKLSDGEVIFTRWFGSNGTSDGIPTGALHRVIVAEHFLIFHQALAHARCAAKEHGLEFKELSEEDFKKLAENIEQYINHPELLEKQKTRVIEFTREHGHTQNVYNKLLNFLIHIVKQNHDKNNAK